MPHERGFTSNDIAPMTRRCILQSSPCRIGCERQQSDTQRLFFSSATYAMFSGTGFTLFVVAGIAGRPGWSGSGGLLALFETGEAYLQTKGRTRQSAGVSRRLGQC